MLTNDNYFTEEGYLHSSEIKTYLDSPYLYKLRHIDKNPDYAFQNTTAVSKGSIVDGVLTEGKSLDDYKMTTAIKRDVEMLVSQIPEFPIWQHLNEKAEFQKIVEGEINGLKFCGKLDAVTPEAIYDLKITNENSAKNETKWGWQVRDFQYAVQAAIYQALEGNNKPFYHVCAFITNKCLVDVRVYQVPQALINYGMNQVIEATEGIKAGNFNRVIAEPVEIPWISNEVCPQEEDNEEEEW